MVDKHSGVDFDRQAFVQAQPPVPRPAPQLIGLFLALVGIAAVAFLGYKLLSRGTADTDSASDTVALTNIDKRLTTIEGRLEKLEVARRAATPTKQEEPALQTPSKPQVRTVYQISPAPPQIRTAPSPTPAPDPAIRSALQKDLGKLQSDDSANREAWQATTNKLADMAGQVGTQGVEILRSQDELTEMLARTEMEAIPFELLRGSNPQSIGPVSLVLKSSNAKTQRYTICVYIQSSCVELKDHTLHEVVQFVLTRNAPALEVIATKIAKDTVLGYLEVPRGQATAH